jgi:hypothetical protein
MKKLILLFISLAFASVSYGQLTLINVGVSPNDHTGDTWRNAFIKVNLGLTQTNTNTTALTLKAPITNASLLGLTNINRLSVGNPLSNTKCILDSISTVGGNIYFYRAGTILTAVPGTGSAVWGAISGTLANQVDLQNALNAKGSGTLVAHDTTHLSNRINLKGSGTLVAHDTTHLSTRINLKANTSALAGYVPVTTTVNGHYLSSNIAVTAADLSLGNIKTGIFNILDYGAISNDGLEDNTAIQLAIEAAYAYAISGSPGTAGKVIIPSGKWYITAPDTLRSYVEIEAGPGSRFYTSSGYTGAFFVAPHAQALEHPIVNGGHYRGATNKIGNWIDLVDNNTGNIFWCQFMNAEVAYVDNVIKLDGSIGGNSNNSTQLSNITALEMRTFSTFKNSSGNTFSNIQIQTDADADSLFIFRDGSSANSITNVTVWDYTGLDAYFAHGCNDNYIQLNGGTSTIENAIVDDGEWNSYDLQGVGDRTNMIIKRVQDYDPYGPVLYFQRQKEVATTRNVDISTILGQIDFQGWHTGAYYSGAQIKAKLSGNVSATDMNTDLEFYTTPDASVTPVKNLVIGSDGVITATGTISTPKLSAVNVLLGYSTTATAGTTTTLTSASNHLQFFTGTLTQTVQMPVTNTLALGWQFTIFNNSTDLVTVTSSGGGTIVILVGGTRAIVTCIQASGTTPSIWDCKYFGLSIASGKKLTASNTLTLVGTDATTMTFPTTSATIARTDAGQTFIGHNTFEGVTAAGATGTTNMVFSSGPTLISPNVTGTLLTAALKVGRVATAAKIDSLKLDGTDLHAFNGTDSLVYKNPASAMQDVTSAVLIHVGDTTVTAIVGRIVFKTSDTHFYGCRKTTASTKHWYQLDN